MMYVDFEAGNKAYKLRLNTRSIVSLEKQLGTNPLAIFGDGSTLPTVENMVYVLYAALQPLNHGITLNDAFDIFDAYLDDGNSIVEFATLLLEIYKVSGIIKPEAEVKAEKN